MTVRPTVSLVATVKDEYASLPAWLQALERQSRQPDEYVIVDGGSSDGTWEMLQGWTPRAPVTVLSEPGISIAEGRNRAIDRARGEIIVVTDAGTVAGKDWIDALTRPFDDPAVDVSAGFFTPSGRTAWLRSLAATTLPDFQEVEPSSFLPSSRSVAFRRSWFGAGVRYPEWLDYCEDLIWDLSMKRAGARFAMAGDALVTFEPRPGATGYFRQYFRYARGDGKAGLFARRHAIRYATYTLAAVVVARQRPVELASAVLLASIYIATPVRRLWRRDRRDGPGIAATLACLPLIPVQRLIGDIAKMAGYPSGLHWRWRRFGSLGWRTTWRRISPDGCRWRPGSTPRETPPSRASRDGESRPVSR